MCKCDPNIKTPWCFNGDCKPTREEVNQIVVTDLSRILSEDSYKILMGTSVIKRGAAKQ